MIQQLKRLVCLLFILGITASAIAQDPPIDPDDYRRFFRKPTTPAEYWSAIKFEMDVGRYDLAAKFLDEMLKKNPEPDQLYDLHEKETMTAFLRLQLVRDWFRLEDLSRLDRADKVAAQKKLNELNAGARKNVRDLIDQVTAAVKAKRSDPDRIKLFVRNLVRSPEERAYAMEQLDLSGAIVVPHLINELSRRKPSERLPILRAMTKLGEDTVPPILAALDMKETDLKLDLLWVLRNRRDFVLLKRKTQDPAPFLWPLASRLESSSLVKKQAQEALSRLYDLPVTQLPLPKVELTLEAEKYYQHTVRFTDPAQVTVWRWLNDQLVRNTDFTADLAEKYFALRFSRQAMEIDPTYKPAQMVFLATSIDKGYVQPKPKEQPLGQLKPKVRDLLSTLSPSLLKETLRRGLRDGNSRVILASIEMLGNQRSTRAKDVLLDALSYGDRRVQMAALDALLRMPGAEDYQVKSRILEILRRAIAAGTKTKARPLVLVALNDRLWREQVIARLAELGFDGVSVARGQDILKRVKEKSDIDAIFLDPTYPRPGLSSLLAQLRIDADVRRLPILLAAVPDNETSREILRRIGKLQRTVRGLEEIVARRDNLSQQDVLRLRVLQELDEKPGRFEVARRKRLAELTTQIQLLSDRYDDQIDKRFNQLARLTNGYRNLFVVTPRILDEPILLQSNMASLFQDTGMPPLTLAEQKIQAEQALFWIGRMARGELKNYSLMPLKDDLIDVLNASKLSEPALVDAVLALGTLPGITVQRELTTIALDEKRPPALRMAATIQLQQHLARHGLPPGRYKARLLETIAEAMRQPGLDPRLQNQMAVLVGTLKPGAAKTGERLKAFTPDLPQPKP